MEEICPTTWMLNLTNPMTQLVRAVTRETAIRTVGLCHEVTICRFYLSMLLDADFRELELTVAGVNHLPFLTKLRIADDDNGLDRLRALLEGPPAALETPLPYALPEDLGHGPKPGDDPWTKVDLLGVNQIKMELFRRFGVLPAAGDRHLAEYFPGFVTEASGWGKRWGVGLTTIERRIAAEHDCTARVDTLLATDEIPVMPSGEMLAPLMDAMLRNHERVLPLNLPNTGQAPDRRPVSSRRRCVSLTARVCGAAPRPRCRGSWAATHTGLRHPRALGRGRAEWSPRRCARRDAVRSGRQPYRFRRYDAYGRRAVGCESRPVAAVRVTRRNRGDGPSVCMQSNDPGASHSCGTVELEMMGNVTEPQADRVAEEAIRIPRAGGDLREARARFMFVAGFRRVALEQAAQQCELNLRVEHSADIERGARTDNWHARGQPLLPFSLRG